MEDYTEECFYCGEEFPQDEMTMVFDYYVCEHCLDEYMQQCDMCDEYWDSTGADWHTVIVDGEEKTICPECFDNYYSICSICGEFCENEIMDSIEDDGEIKLICQSCLDEIAEKNECN